MANQAHGWRQWRRASLWLLGLGFMAAAALGVFWANSLMGEVRAGNAWGIGYGTAAAVLLVVVAALGVRRRTMRLSTRLGLGHARTWLDIHIFGGVLFLLLMLMHSGFRLPTGWVTWWLWSLSIWTVASGVLGVVIQKWIPRQLSSGLSVEVNYDRIPDLSREVLARAEELTRDSSEPILDLFERTVAPVLEGPRRRLIYLVDVTGGAQAQLREFRYLRQYLTPEEDKTLDRLEDLFKTKLEMDAHYTLQPILKWWLYIHVPTSMLLVGFFVLHLASVFLY